MTKGLFASAPNSPRPTLFRPLTSNRSLPLSPSFHPVLYHHLCNLHARRITLAHPHCNILTLGHDVVQLINSLQATTPHGQQTLTWDGGRDL